MIARTRRGVLRTGGHGVRRASAFMDRTQDFQSQAVRRGLYAGGRRIRTLGPSRREVLERSNISTRWILFQGVLRVRIRRPPAASQQRTVPAVGFDGARPRFTLN